MYRAHFAPKPGHIALSPHLAGSLVVACLSLLWRERHCGLAFSNGGYLKLAGSLKTACMWIKLFPASAGSVAIFNGANYSNDTRKND